MGMYRDFGVQLAAMTASLLLCYDLVVVFQLYSLIRNKGAEFSVKDILLFVIAFIIVSPITINSLLVIIFSRSEVIGNGGFIIGSSSDWLTFWGSILGGCVTMIAVYFTIKAENETQRRTTAVQIVPVLIAKSCKQVYFGTNTTNNGNKKDSSLTIGYSLEILNNSYSVACDMHFDSATITIQEPFPAGLESDDSAKIIYIENELNKQFAKNQALYPQLSEFFKFHIDLPLTSERNVLIKARFSYKDYLFENTHFVEAIIEFIPKYNKTGKTISSIITNPEISNRMIVVSQLKSEKIVD